MNLSWLDFKKYIDNTNYKIVYTENKINYYISTIDGPLVTCELRKDEATEFEASYKSNANAPHKIYDDSGVPLARHKITKDGFGLACLVLNFQTGKYNSFRSKEDDNTTDVAGFTHKIYDNTNTEITSAANESNAVKTIITYKPAFDYELIGAEVFQSAPPANDIYGYMTALPNIPAGMGGDKPMCYGGMNFKLLDKGFALDGRAPLLLPYAGGIGTNELKFSIYYSTYEVHSLQIKVEHYR